MKFGEQESQSGEGNYGLKIGIAEFKVVAVNPTLQELQKLLNTDKITKDPEYLGEKGDKDYVNIVFWVEDVKTGQKYPYRFTITNQVKVWEKSGKTVWVNQTGSSSTVANKEDLPGWFTEFYKSKDDKTVIAEAEYRKALEGENELYEFFRKWLLGRTEDSKQINWFSPNTNILQDTKKLLRGKVDEIREMITSPYAATVVLALYVARVEKDGDVKYYQNISKDAGAGWLMKKINLSIQQNSWDADKATKDLKNKWAGPEYSITSRDANAFVLDHLQAFNAEEHVNMTDKTITGDTGSVDDMDY